MLSRKTQNSDLPFFRVMTAFFLAKIASSMRATLVTKDRGEVPVNLYALSLATSGAGKGHSVNLLESTFLKGFKDRFINESQPTIADNNLWNMANQRAIRNNSDPGDEHKALADEYRRAGPIAFTFDSGTAPAVKQLRHKLLMASSGAINLQIDEIGSNLIANTEVLNTFLELYDQGLIKQKLTKSTADNIRTEEIDGKTPTNMLLFGTPSKLLDGGKVEDEFYSFLETGYARRCFFAYGEKQRNHEQLSAQEIYQRLTDTSNETIARQWSTHFATLADTGKFGFKIDVSDDVAIELLSYRMNCEKMADTYGEHEEIRKAEMSHRYFKALKLAGVFAFIEESNDLTMDHLHQAIKLVEESGASFQRIFTRDKNYVKLAKFLASHTEEQTHADLVEALPYFKGSIGARNEIINLATAWGYKNHIVIKKTFYEGIEFYRGETLKKTSLDKLILSYSSHMAYNYQSAEAPFSQLQKLTSANGLHWINHRLERSESGNGHRAEENVVPGFNMVVVDVDGGTPIETCKELLKDYTYFLHTTKSSTPDDPRFRLILPINYELHLDEDDFKEFMQNVFAWLPFNVDTQTGQRSRKWASFDGEVHTNEGILLDVLKFIPKTSRNEDFKASIVKMENLDNLERWFAQRMVEGSRNNHMLRFALALVDSGLSYQEIETKVFAFNDKLDNKLPVDELRHSVLVTAAQRVQARP